LAATKNSLIQKGKKGTFWGQVTFQDKAFWGLENETVVVSNVDETVAAIMSQKLAAQVGQTKAWREFCVVNGKATILAGRSALTLERLQPFKILRSYFGDYQGKLTLPVKTEKAEITTSDLVPLYLSNPIISDPLFTGREWSGRTLADDQPKTQFLIIPAIG